MTAEPRDVLVASAGGHLAQLHLLAQRLVPVRPRTWVTYDHPQAASLLAGEHVVHGAGPSSRSARAAVRNWVLAGRLLDPDRVARVVSTGAAISVPFLVRAERRGIETHYVESATRADGPSLSGRILERSTRHTGLHTQHEACARGRWEATASVFDGFSAERHLREDGPLRVVVSLGTHRFAFPRLLRSLAGGLRDDDEVLLQHGATTPVALPGHVRAEASLSAEAMQAALQEADVVVGHAGTGLALSSLLAGRVPVLLARSAGLGEHVDDHQGQTVRTLASRGLAEELGDRAERVVLRRAAGAVVAQVATMVPLELGDGGPTGGEAG